MNLNLKDTDRLIQNGSFQQAEEALAQMDQSDPAVLYQLGICRFRRQDFEGAEATFRKTIAQKTDAYRGWYYLGLALERQGKLDEAINAYRVCSSMAPQFEQARKKLKELGSLAPQVTVEKGAPLEKSEVAPARAPASIAEEEMMKGVYTERKGAFTFHLQRIFSFLFGGAIGGMFIGVAAGLATEQTDISLVAGVIGGVLIGLVSAGNVSRRIN